MIGKNKHMYMRDYIEHIGNYTFDEKSFSDEDMVLFAQLMYAELENVSAHMDVYMPHREKKVCKKSRKSLRDISAIYCDMEEDFDIKNEKRGRDAAQLMKLMSDERRYKDVELSNYMSITAEDENMQIAACTFDISNNVSVIVFRGTDASIVGWKEDFMFSFKTETKGQRTSVMYIDYVARETDENKTLIVGGHSKGGNLAVYGSVFCSEYAKNKIARIYSLDGPGFLREILEVYDYQRQRGKIVSIVPDAPVVSNLLESDVAPNIIESSGKSVLKHDLTTWKIEDGKLKNADKMASTSKIFKVALDEWIKDIPYQKREDVIELIFDIIRATDTNSIYDVRDESFDKLRKLREKVKELPLEKRRELRELILSFFGETTSAIKSEIKGKIENFMERI